MSKRVLITGITGMAGSYLAELLLATEPACTIAGTKRQSSSLENLAGIADRVEIFDCDLLDAEDCLDLVETVRPDVIYHLAALSNVLSSWTTPKETIGNNIGMQLNIFDAVRLLKLDPLIQVALSSEQYGRVYPDELPITEKNHFRPLSPYAVSKVAQDMLAYQYHQSYGIKTIRTRTFNHEGPRRPEAFVASNFAKQIAEIEAGIKPPILYVGNLAAMRDWSDVRDIVRAYQLATQYCAAGEDYIIASGISRSVDDILQLLLSFTKATIDVVPDPARMRPSDVEITYGDPAKFVKISGWRPLIPFEQTMKDLLDHWRVKINAGQGGESAALKVNHYQG
jgi:GDP-4-dehydro-6-deoxy-D-mannose reductase